VQQGGDDHLLVGAVPLGQGRRLQGMLVAGHLVATPIDVESLQVRHQAVDEIGIESGLDLVEQGPVLGRAVLHAGPGNAGDIVFHGTPLSDATPLNTGGYNLF